MSDLTGRWLGQYELRELIRYGGMAAVYKAYQPSLDRWVAVKVLSRPGDPTFVARFEAEARSIARFQHPNIVPIHDYGEQQGNLYLVVTYVEDGRSLVDLVGDPMEPERALKLGLQMLAGLSYAHDKGVVHRDIKPSNVLLPSRDWPMLADFGIAKLLLGEGRDLTKSGMVLGTAAYMAPEQTFGLPVDARTDLYSVGVVLYELMTGRVPFDAETPVMVMMKQAYELPEPPRAVNPEVPLEVERLLLQALTKDPADRFGSAEAMSEAITATLARLQLQDQPPTIAPSTPTVPVDPLSAYMAGIDAYTAGRWAEAVERLGQVHSTDPDFEDVEALLDAARSARDRSVDSAAPSQGKAAAEAPPRPAPDPARPVQPPARPAPAMPPPATPPSPAFDTAPWRPPPAAKPSPGAAKPAPVAQAGGVPKAPSGVAKPPPVTPAASPVSSTSVPTPAKPSPVAAKGTQGAAKAPARAVRTEEQPSDDEAPPRRRGRLLWVAVAAVAFVVGTVIGFQLLNNGDQGGKTGSATAAAPPRTTAPKPGEQPWTATAEAPLGVESAGTEVFQGKAWVAGGMDRNRKGRAEVFVYDPASDKWSQGPTLPLAVSHAALVSTGDELFVIGGYRGSTTDPITTVRRLDPATSTWRRAPSLPVALGAGAAAWDGRRIVYAGGVGASGEPSNAAYAFENGAWRQVDGTLTRAREHLAAVSDGKGRTFFLGGEVNKGSLKTALATVDVVQGDTVRKVGDLSTARGSVGGFFSPSDGACVGGGRDGKGGLFAEVECIRLNGATRKLPNLNTARHGLGMVAIDGSAYALLGADNDAKTFRTGEVRPLAS